MQEKSEGYDYTSAGELIAAMREGVRAAGSSIVMREGEIIEVPAEELFAETDPSNGQ